MFPSHSPLIDAQTRFLTSLKFWTSSLLPALRGRAAVIDTLHLTNLSLENSSPGAGVSDCEVPVGQLLESALVLLQQWPNLPRHDYNCKALQIEAEQFPWIPFFAALLELCSRSRGQILMTNCKYVKPGLLCQNTPQGHQPESELEAIGLARLLLLLPALPDGDGSTQSIGNSEQLSSHSSQEFESHDGREPSTNSTAARRNTSRHEHSAAGAQCTRKFEGLGNEASTTTGSSDLSGNSEPGPGDCTSERQAEIETEYPPSSDSGTDSLDLGSASGVATPLPEYGTLYDSLPPAVVQQHIFPAPFYPCPLSPVICIADEDNICPLILSILSQRQVLHPGDTTPVIGIVYMAGIQLCQVVLGRVELTDSDQIQYQLATAMDPNAGVDSGVFRLQQALELHAFARFLLSTASEGTRLINVCTSGWDSEHDTARAWRADWAAIFMPDDHSQICNDRENEWQFDQWLHEATSPRSLYVSNSDYEGRSGRETPFLSQGLDRLLGATISDPLDFEYPGIAEWSFDHLVLTIGFAPSSPNLNHHKLAFDSMSAMLFPYLDLSIKTCHVQASEPALSRWHVASLAPHACDALNEIDVQALSIVISKSFAEDCIHMTAPASHALWMKAVDWFSARWRCKASSRCLPSFNHWRVLNQDTLRALCRLRKASRRSRGKPATHREPRTANFNQAPLAIHEPTILVQQRIHESHT
ncbi:hypothetical protein C8Q70DRAFT_651798 [Cubamyces menziesii]|nr:hypothetical protein C8Q70DRAFT_651798 [Cubamyces menziesii]